MNRQSGFTLLETLIAFSILAISLGTLYATFQDALSRTTRDEHLFQATALANSVLTQASVPTADLPQHGSGRWRDFDYTINASRTTHSTNASDAPACCKRVTVKVSWPAPSGTRSIQLSTLTFYATGSP